MEELKERLKMDLTEELVQLIISNQRKGTDVSKVKVRPFLEKNILLFQESRYIGTKVYHKNYTKDELIQEIQELLTHSFKQLELETISSRTIVLVSKQGKITIKTKKVNQTKSKTIDLAHNRKKKYILPEGEVIPFLVDLGIQSKEGNILHAKYDKFKQINRYLEFLEDIFPELEKYKIIRIVDFGCGKAYLTFAMYYYLVIVRKKNVEIIGLDLKEDVVQRCNQLKEQYGYDQMNFQVGHIEDYESKKEIDMVVSLHACDTATDYALEKAVKWNAKVIFAVPCCQHEVNQQIQNEMLAPILQYGIIKERISALMTDAIRANILTEYGYQTQILEFIDMEHTPKNLLIRAVRKNNFVSPNMKIRHTMKELHVTPTITKLL
ncbi:MAG: SAM-dependent methyltransferase [Eubacteriales bacterium]